MTRVSSSRETTRARGGKEMQSAGGRRPRRRWRVTRTRRVSVLSSSIRPACGHAPRSSSRRTPA
eukprot:2384740-Rhodomonas_salina.2